MNGSYNDMRNWKWSHTEKTIARQAFERALGQELQAVIDEVKKRAARIEQPSDRWKLERYLTQKRQEIDRKYDYRYSVLPIVFTTLLREGRITEEDLRDLRQEKLDFIRRAVTILSAEPE
jgi:hypothetical protein